MNNQAELISVGSELLNGRTKNAHAQILGRTLSRLGLMLTRDTTIPDDIDVMQTVTKEAIRRAGMVFISGGLGPTSDDITRDAISTLFNCPIVMDSDTVREITRRSAAAGKIMTEAALRQAQVLKKAEVLPNSVGYAPGQKIALNKGRFLFLLPGPPTEFAAVLEDNIVPWLHGRFIDIQPILSKEIRTKGVGESDIVTLLESNNFEPWDVKIGFYPGGGKVDIHLSAEQEHRKELEDAYTKLYRLLEHFIVEEETELPDHPAANDSFF